MRQRSADDYGAIRQRQEDLFGRAPVGEEHVNVSAPVGEHRGGKMPCLCGTPEAPDYRTHCLLSMYKLGSGWYCTGRLPKERPP